MADASNGTDMFAILLKSTMAEETDGRKKKVDKGELLIEIFKKNRISRQSGKEPAHNYFVYKEPTVTLFDDGTKVCPLQETQFKCLAAVPDRTVRFAQYKTGKMEWVTNLKVGDMVFFHLFMNSNAQARPIIRGKIRYFGKVQNKEGFTFGIEIMDHNFRGKGTTDGSPYFNCGQKNGVYVAMDKITKIVNGEGSPPANIDTGSNEDETITTEPKLSDEGPADNLRSRGKGGTNGDGGKTFLTKAKDLKDKITAYVAPGLPSVAHVSIPSDVHCRFSLGDCVILQSAKGGTVKGVVKWTEPMRTSRETGNIVIPVVGIETNRPVSHEEEFPGLCYNVTGSHKQNLFTVAHNHGRIYIAEQVVLTEDEYRDIKRKEESEEAREAKKWGMSVDEYAQQGELLSERNAEKGRVDDQRNRDPNSHMDEEKTTVGGGVGGHKIGGKGLEKTIQIGPDGDLLLSEEYVEEQQQAFMKFNKQKSKDDGYEVVNYPSMNNDQSPSLGRYPSHPQSSSNPEQNIATQKEYHDQQHKKSNIEMTHPDSWQSQQIYGQTNPPDRHDEHASYSSQFSDDMNDVLKPTHPRHDDHRSPSLQSHYNNPPQYKPPAPQPQYSASSTGHTPPMGDTGSKPRHPSIPSDPTDFTVGTMVNVQMQHGSPRHGVVQWIGTLPDMNGMFAGVELDEYLDKCSDGTYNGRRYFTCPYGRGLFCLVSALQLDKRYMESHQLPAARKQDLKNPLCDIPQHDDSDTPGGPELFSKYIGDYHGIQGHHNSCYLDATVFGLFALSDSFDELLLEEPYTDIGKTIKEILWKGIVNPFRRYGVARFESIMELRDQLEALGRMKGANRDEKDPEEFLNLLFKEILHVKPFISIKRPFGVEKEFFVQLFFEIEENKTAPPDTEKLINKMFYEQNISFTTVPSKLLLQMPRFGKEFKMFNKIIPSRKMDVKSLLDRGSGEVCGLCLELTATIKCATCCEKLFQSDQSDEHHHPFKYLCENCSSTVHKKRQGHKWEEIESPVSKFSTMQLLSVICIETSHYVCFTRNNDKWLFHDSMADRVYDTFNIPRVTDVSEELNHWVYNPDNHQKLLSSPSRDIPECVRRFTQDIYMCVYTNPDLDRYGGPTDSLLDSNV